MRYSCQCFVFIDLSKGNGVGVNAYIIDTGIYPDNKFFSERAFVAYDNVGDGKEGIDCNGHGTHCAGTIGGEVFGIAREASLYGVRVLDCAGSGSTSSILDGMDFVAKNAKHPAVASMSLRSPQSEAMEEAVRRMNDADVTVSVSAGNSAGDACNQSPASAKEAITVGATDIEDQRASFSNYGKCVDLFAPGVDIPSLWMGGDFEVNTISGTSMSCPHVSGAAVIARSNDPTLEAAEVKAKILKDATPDVVKNPGPESPNLMLYIP
ncbi:extracellular serine proteinase-like [Patiria miniata]|uniref:Peptidase S8/S53 domain-containing protein n=1 Tax=Patiria miniata TaxID=46514 RepID=A0A914BB53_PATMI|nr:extracellular serine proteinase-like [Patiria miniata]